MKSKLLTALASSIVIALLACPFLASPIGDIASGVMPDASVFPPQNPMRQQFPVGGSRVHSARI